MKQSFEEYQKTEGYEEVAAAAKTMSGMYKALMAHLPDVCEVPEGKEFHVTEEGMIVLRNKSRRVV